MEDNQINERIKQLRQALNLSQAKFAKQISISNGYIAAIELGNRVVNDRLVKLICSQFDVNEDWLNTGYGNMFDETKDKNFKQALSVFNDLKPEYQEYVLIQIKELLKMQNKEESLSQ